MRSLVLTGFLWLAGATSVLATDVTFNGTLAASCTLALGTNGTLGLSADGQDLSSAEGGGTKATVTILSIGSNSVNVAAPTLDSAPSAYDPGGQSLEMAYSGAGLLSSVTSGWSQSASSFAVGTIALSILDIDNRIHNPNGFAAGSYAMRTVVTCS